MEGSFLRFVAAFVVALVAGGCQTLDGHYQQPRFPPEPVSATPTPTPTPTPARIDVEPVCRFETPREIQGAAFEDVIRLAPEDEAWENRRCKEFRTATAELVEISVEGTPLVIPVPGEADAFGVGLRATLTGRLFDTGEVRLRKSAQADIGMLAGSFYRSGRTRLVVIGHSDASGSTSFNFELSLRRAAKVAQTFAQFGVQPDRITIAGSGETRSIADNESETGRALNRRIEIVESRRGETLVGLVADAYQPTSLLEFIAAERRAAEVAAARAERDRIAQERLAFVGTRRADASSVNFGGAPAEQSSERLAPLVGQVEKPSIWERINLLRQARAMETDETLNLACSAAELDNPAFQRRLVRANNAGELSGPWVSRLGLYGTAWAGDVNGHLVTLANMAVLATGIPETAPTLYLHRRFKGGAAKADIRARGAATATLGEMGLLYRAYFEEDAWPVRCIDLVFDRKNPGTFRHGKLYYENNGRIYVATYEPAPVEI